MEKTEVLERIRGHEEELRRARENETKLKKNIEELEKECIELSCLEEDQDKTINRKGEEVEASKMEKTQVLERIRGQEEELRRARENETKLKTNIEELQKECNELRLKEMDIKESQEQLRERERNLQKEIEGLKIDCNRMEERERYLEKEIEKLKMECNQMEKSCSRWDPLLKERKDQLSAREAELIDLQDKNDDLEEELKRQRQKIAAFLAVQRELQDQTSGKDHLKHEQLALQPQISDDVLMLEQQNKIKELERENELLRSKLNEQTREGPPCIVI
ncbi:golgin subfamily A member 6-like protein 7 [Mya arenaria]|uniref:golgin subfamily A member 6-like protein 7 n=1 Tax=Mya arenaria TaxID=6604 RepID=UPI0022DF136F|nr:golgin subfamily A member 6-like protein 7 [Mya arenaria]